MDSCVYQGHYERHTFFHCVILKLYTNGTIYGRNYDDYRQQYTQLKTDDQLTQTSPPHDEYIMEIRQRWIPTPFME